MQEFVSRVEFDDLVRHLTTKIDHLHSRVAGLTEQVAALEFFAIGNGFSIRFLGRLLQSLLPVEQRELLDLESRAGVTDVDILDRSSIEPNDGFEWRRRLKERADELRARSQLERVTPSTATADEVSALKEVGSLFQVDPELDGPCFNRDQPEKWIV